MSATAARRPSAPSCCGGCAADRRPAAEALQALEDTEATPEQRVELLGILWPSYFASPDAVPHRCLAVRIAEEASVGLWADLERELPALAVALGAITVPVGVLAGQESPMPPEEAATATAERIPGAWVLLEADAGHFPWVERPGCVVAAVDRLAGAGRADLRGSAHACRLLGPRRPDRQAARPAR